MRGCIWRSCLRIFSLCNTKTVRNNNALFEEQNKLKGWNCWSKWNQYCYVMSDARHLCRKNRFQTDHIAFCQITHKVLYIQYITKEDYDVTQRHEHLACSRMHWVRMSRTQTSQNTRMIGMCQSTSWSKRVESETWHVSEKYYRWHKKNKEGNQT